MTAGLASQDVWANARIRVLTKGERPTKRTRVQPVLMNQTGEGFFKLKIENFDE